MGIFGLFKKKKTTVNIKVDCYPQDSKDSITKNGYYDFTRISHNENKTIINVIRNSKRKYPANYLSIGLILESYPVIYKERHILHELIIIKYENSVASIDMLAVAIAYERKGAVYRKKAIAFFEKALQHISEEDWKYVSLAFQPCEVYAMLSELYEKEYQFTEALKYANLSIQHKDEISLYDIIHRGDIYKKIDIAQCVEYYKKLDKNPILKIYKQDIKTALQEAKEKQDKGYIYRPRKSKKEPNYALENEIHTAAMPYVKMI